MTLAFDYRDLNFIAVNVDIFGKQNIRLDNIVGVETGRENEGLVRMQNFIFLIKPQIVAEFLQNGECV